MLHFIFVGIMIYMGICLAPYIITLCFAFIALCVPLVVGSLVVLFCMIHSVEIQHLMTQYPLHFYGLLFFAAIGYVGYDVYKDRGVKQ